MIREIDHKLIEPNPDQPRKRFPQGHIDALADSIRERGQIQAIVVRQKGRRFQIVAGECRWRACKLLNRKVRCDVQTMTDLEMRLRSIVENLQRRDMNPMEEARAFQSLIDGGFTVERVINDLGLKSVNKVKSRLDLLELRPEIAGLVETGQLEVSKAWAVAQAPREHQRKLMNDILSGKIKTTEQARHIGIAMKSAHAQLEAFDAMPRPSKRDLMKLTALESKIEAVKQLAVAGFKDGECVAAQRVAPGRVATMADKLLLIRKHLLQMENELRVVASQREFILSAGKR